MTVNTALLGGNVSNAKPKRKKRRAKKLTKHTSPPIPFLKWAGGKRRLLAQYRPYIPSVFGQYHEPFVGGGALFFHLDPSFSVLSDANLRLIQTYRAIRDDIEGVLEALYVHRACHCERYYYTCREKFNHADSLERAERAALMIYLNKTCYNGLYRENAKGFFNVPIGQYKSPKVFNEDNLRKVHKKLQSVELRHSSFEGVLDRAKSNDLIFFDPPYVPLSATSSFTTYTKDGFGLEHQRHLAKVVEALSKRGCYVMLSNSDCPFVRDLYQNHRILEISASRSINSLGSSRGAVKEVLVLNW